MSFTFTVDAAQGGNPSTQGDLTTTSINTGGYLVSGTGTLDSFTNNSTILGGGGQGQSGKNALQIDSLATITTLINTGSFCGGGGGGQQRPSQYACAGGAGGGGGGSNAGQATSEPGNGGDAFSNGVKGDGGAGGGGGGFNKNGGGSITQGYGTGTLAGGGGGDYANGFGNAGPYGAGISDTAGGGGAGGGKGGSNNGGGGGGGGQGGGGGFNGGYGIYNYGTITTLENQQGIGNGLGALFYGANLPDTYNIILNSISSFGQLFYTGWSNINSTTNTLNNFNISTLSSYTPASGDNFDAVLVNITNPNSSAGTYKGFNWYILEVPAGSVNCKGNKVTIGGINYSSYDLYFTSSSSTYITLDSLNPSTGEPNQILKVNFTTNIKELIPGGAAIINFDSVAISNVSITGITYDSTGIGTGTLSGTIPLGTGSSNVNVTINEITSLNTLTFTYTTTINLVSLIPSRADGGQQLIVTFTTNIQELIVGGAANINFDSVAISNVSITGITYDSSGIGTGSVSGTIPPGKGTSNVSIKINETTSTTTLPFTYTTTQTFAEQLTFTGDKGIVDSNNNLFAFVLESFKNNVSSNFTVTVNNKDIYSNCVFSFTSTDPTNTSTLQSVQLTVTNTTTLNAYNLIYNPYETKDNKIKTYVTYTDIQGNSIISYSNYPFIINPVTDTWYFESDSSSTDSSNEIIYDSTNNFIAANTTDQLGPLINYQNIGTLGMVGASNSFIAGISLNTENQDTYYASVAWCFFALYSLTGKFEN
jgi:hypothetical protein